MAFPKVGKAGKITGYVAIGVKLQPPFDLCRRPVMDGMSPLPSAYELAPDEAERERRVQLAAAYRLADHFGWTELIYCHLTARCPWPEHHF